MIQPCTIVWLKFKLVVKDLKTPSGPTVILIEEKRRKADERKRER